MKKLLLTFVATMGLAMGAFAQGTIYLNNSSLGCGDVLLNGEKYSGAVTFEVYVNNGITPLGWLNSSSYSMLANYGYLYQQTLSTTVSDGMFFINAPAVLPDVTAHASAANLVLVAYMSGKIGLALTEFRVTNLGDNNPVAGSSIDPGDINNMGDLNMIVPEPSTIVLGVLGLSTLLFRRRK